MPKNNSLTRRKARQEAARLRDKESLHRPEGVKTGITRKAVEDDVYLQPLTSGEQLLQDIFAAAEGGSWIR